jgi:hypothetical protein
MYEAVLIKPKYLRDRGKKSIACTFSGLKYTTEEYEALFSAKKLAYFEFTSFIHTHPIVCHEVLYKYLCQLSDNPKQKILHIKDGKEIKKCRVSCFGGINLDELKGFFK